jgi:hypothetical protein
MKGGNLAYQAPRKEVSYDIHDGLSEVSHGGFGAGQERRAIRRHFSPPNTVLGVGSNYISILCNTTS